MDTAQELRIYSRHVRDMRTAQREYFMRIRKAKQSKHPDDFAAATRALQLSKDLEAQVDAETEKYIKL